MIIRVAIAEQQIHIAIIIKIKKLQSPTTEKFCRRADSCGKRDIAKALIPIVMVEREHLLIDIRNEEIDPAVLIVVGGANYIPRPGPPALLNTTAESTQISVNITF